MPQLNCQWRTEQSEFSYHSVIKSSKKHLRLYSLLVLNKSSKIFQGIHWCLQLITSYWQEYKQWHWKLLGAGRRRERSAKVFHDVLCTFTDTIPEQNWILNHAVNPAAVTWGAPITSISPANAVEGANFFFSSQSIMTVQKWLELPANWHDVNVSFPTVQLLAWHPLFFR